ncbi:MAG: D-alanyl-D-alanine carboxypeptidase/D-alanyl-D-alanine-endopeptidase [Bacteroidetes bacterium]|nr:D-alanyl-D-alanine carboxypeptidase/D-alanyl-D-alanine-endopeptidase [Bacteroidota bacterium]
MKNLIIALFLLLSNTYAQNIQKDLIKNICANLPKGTNYSIFIYDPMEDDTLYSHQINKPLIPASNIKLFTTAALINTLGDQYELETLLLTDDPDLNDKVVNGNIYIRGTGDPSIGYEDIDSLVNRIKLAGISKVTGNIYADASIFDNLYTRDDWIVDEKANVVLPPVAGLVMNRNSIHLTLIKTKSTGKVDYEVKPNYNFIKVTVNNQVRNKNHRFESTLKQSSSKIDIELRYNPNRNFNRKYFTEYVINPATFWGLVLKAELELKGISIGGEVIEGKPKSDTYILQSIVTPLTKILNFTNKDSNNYFAECLFKLLGWTTSEDQGNSFYATQAVMQFLESINVDITDLEIVDGSGISRFNRLTTSAIVSLLTEMYFDEKKFPLYLNSMAVGSTDGTLQKRFSNASYGKNFHGKTGTLNGVSSISGYLTTKSNKDLIVSILMEFNRNGANYYRDIQDKILEILIEKE